MPSAGNLFDIRAHSSFAVRAPSLLGRKAESPAAFAFIAGTEGAEASSLGDHALAGEVAGPLGAVREMMTQRPVTESFLVQAQVDILQPI